MNGGPDILQQINFPFPPNPIHPETQISSDFPGTNTDIRTAAWKYAQGYKH